MPMAHIRKVGGREHDLYHVHWLDADHGPGSGGGERPDQGLPGGRPERPDQGLPGMGGRPDQGLPGGGGHPDQGGPRPPHIGGRPPGSGGNVGIPDNELPEGKPPQLAPGWLLVLARGGDGKWHYAAMAPGSAAPKPLPEPLPPEAGNKPVDPNEPPPPGAQTPSLATPT